MNNPVLAAAAVDSGKPTTSRIAVKFINHLGNEVMKVFKV